MHGRAMIICMGRVIVLAGVRNLHVFDKLGMFWQLANNNPTF